MAIQNRRGDFKDFDPYKMVPGEFAIITSGDPSSKDGTSVYHCFAPGVVKRLTSYEDLKEQVDSSVEEIIDEQIEQIETNKQNIENLQHTVDNIKIPSKTSQLQNDSNFLTQHQDLSDYAKKATTLAGYGITDGTTNEQFNQVQQEIDDYESVLTEYVDSDIEPQNGFYNLRMQFISDSSYRYIAAPVTAGETIQVTGAMPAVDGLAVCIFVDSGGNIVGYYKDASAEAEAIAVEDVCAVPDSAVMVYVNSKSSAEISLKKYELVDIKGRLKNAENSIEEINAETESIRNDVSHAVNKVDEITEQVAASINLLPPESINGYIDATDGETFISSAHQRCTVDKIPIHTQKLYVMVNPDVAVSGNGIIAIVQYDSEGKYIKTISKKVTASGVIINFTINENATAIKIWTNEKLELADICVAEESFDTFEPYSLKTVVKTEAIVLEHILTEGKPFFGKTIVNFGDSIFGNKRPPNDVSTALANITGATVHNCGFGGCRMANHNENWDAFSMYRLAYAIANNDFSVQDAVDISSVSGMPAYFEKTRALLKSIDWNTVDIITIAYGTNDFTGGITLDSTENLYNTDTFGGALRYSIETILGTYPHLKVFVCGQTYRFWMDSGNVFTEDSDTRIIMNRTLLDFVETTAKVAKEYKLPFIDNYYELGINKYNRGYYFPENDGTHHNVLGAKLMAEHIASELF